MPSVKQYDWSKLTPKIEEHRPLTNPNVRGWKLKADKVKRVRRPRKDKAVDSRIFNDVYDQNQHLRDIAKEQ